MSNMVINTNVMALTSHRSMKNVGTTLSKTSERLSTGLRINRAADDAAGLAISEKMRSQIRGLDQASRNAQDGISLIQTAEGALQETHEMMQRMRELVVQASSDALEQSDRDKIALEVDELSKEIQDTAAKTQYNKKQLIDGSWEKQTLYIQVGANELQGLEFNIGAMDADKLGINIQDIGDIIRGKYSTTVSNQTVGIADVPGKYDTSVVKSLGIKSITLEKLDPTVLGAGGVLKLSNSDSITVGNDGSVTIVGTVADDDGTVSWSAGDDVTMQDLIGKTFTNSDGDKLKIMATEGVEGGITVEKTAVAKTGETVTLGAPRAEDYKVGNIELNIDADGNVNMTDDGDRLYDIEGNRIAGGSSTTQLAADTTYYDANGVTLFKTDAADASKLTVFEKLDERTLAQGTTALHINSSVKLEYDGTKTKVAEGAVFTKNDNASVNPEYLEEVTAELKANTKYYDTDGNILFETGATVDKISEYAQSELQLNAPAGAAVELEVGGTGTGISVGADANGVLKFTGNSTGLTITDSSGTTVNVNDTLAAGDYIDNASKKLLFTVNADKSITSYDETEMTLTGEAASIKAAISAGGKLILSDADSKTFSLNGAAGSGVAAGDELADGTYCDNSSKQPLFTVKDGAITAYTKTDDATDLKTAGITVTIGGTTITGAGSNVTIEGATLYDKDGGQVAAGTGKTLAADTTYYDSAGTALFTTGGSADALKEVYTTVDFIKSGVTSTVGTAPTTTSYSLASIDKGLQSFKVPDAVSVADDEIEITKVGDDLKLTSLASGLTGKVATMKDDGSYNTAVAADETLAEGDYYNTDTGKKLFSVGADGAITDFSKGDDASVVTTESLYTPASSLDFNINQQGTVFVTGGENLKVKGDDSFVFENGVTTLEELVGKTIVDEAGGKEWKFEKITNVKDPDYGKITVTEFDTTLADPDADPPVLPTQVGEPHILTIDVPEKGTPNTTLGSFAQGLDLSMSSGSFVIAADGSMSITGSVYSKDSLEASSYDPHDGQPIPGAVPFDSSYDFNTQTDHYGKTFELAGAIISFDGEGKASIENTSGGHKVDASRMNEGAKEAYEHFNTEMKKIQADGGSHGKIISLLTGKLDASIESVSTQRAQLGAYQNRLEHTIKNLDIASENLSAAESRIRDADMAKEMMKLTKTNVLQSAAISMLAQANQAPQNLLQLLR